MSRYVFSYRKKALVVDDDDNIIAAFRDFFVSEECDMISASSVREAISIAAGTPLDLLITDIRLADRSGVSLFLELRASEPSLPIIVITGYPDAITEKEVRELGARFFLVKPLDLTTLRKAVRSCLNPPGGGE